MKREFTYRHLVKYGECIPKGWGIAYHKFDLARVVCYPIPLNWLVGWSRSIWFKTAKGPRDNLVVAISEAESRGREQGELAATRKFERFITGLEAK